MALVAGNGELLLVFIFVARAACLRLADLKGRHVQ